MLHRSAILRPFVYRQLMPRYVYSPHYRVDIGPHVFPTAKYGIIRQRLIDEDGARPSDFLEPEPAAEADVLLVHTPDYYQKCRDAALSVEELWRLELPWSEELFDASLRCVQGSILAARLAIEHGVGLHIGGGFHHAFPDHGEGFCVFNDHACAIRRLQADGVIDRALVVDCDLHQGNGTAAIFADDNSVPTFSIHQQHLYPVHKPPGTVDVGLPSGADDKCYLRALEKQLLPLIRSHQPQLLAYVGGADPYVHDQLGSLGLSLEGLRQRDALVVEACNQARIPLLVLLAGGYATQVEETVTIHLGTLREAARLWRPSP
ncbi:MAG: histone deacetylase [Acidobacteriota bacterium]